MQTKIPALSALAFSFGQLFAHAFAANPEAVTIGYQKASIFALLKYCGTLNETFKKEGINIRWVEFLARPQMLEG